MIATNGFKINIGLQVTEKMPDGFHNLETIFYPVDSNQDRIEILHTDADTFLEVTGADFVCDMEKNLCVKAFRLLEKEFALSPVKIRLHKNIPSGAGVGGGSANAALTLRMLNKLFDLHLTIDDLKKYASFLGSDVAFFIENKPAFATGRGDQLTTIPIDLSNYEIRMLFLPIAVNTAQAYKQIIPHKSTFNLSHLQNLPLEQWKEYVFNDFESVVFMQYPEIKEYKEQMYNQGALYASMSGSGSAVYGIFKKNIVV